jgi:hypothetical protein
MEAQQLRSGRSSPATAARPASSETWNPKPWEHDAALLALAFDTPSESSSRPGTRQSHSR